MEHNVERILLSPRGFSYMNSQHPHLLRCCNLLRALLAGLFSGGDVCDAYLAGTAATLAAQMGESRPEWVDRPSRYLGDTVVCKSWR